MTKKKLTTIECDKPLGEEYNILNKKNCYYLSKIKGLQHLYIAILLKRQVF